MVKDDLYITVPTYFRCPISLDVMKSPVSLCTGVTYDRTSIQRWLNSGNNTCPATMQVLQTKELVPNHTLQRLIQIWSDSVQNRRTDSPPCLSNQVNSLTRDQVQKLVNRVEIDIKKLISISKDGYTFLLIQTSVQSISKLILFANEADDNAKFLSSESSRLLPVLVAVLGNKQFVKDVNLIEKIVRFCNVILQHFPKNDFENQASSTIVPKIEFGKEFKQSLITGLKQGRLGFRAAIAKFLDLIANFFPEVRKSIAVDDELYHQLLKLMSDCEASTPEFYASLSCLISLSLPKRNRSRIVRAGCVDIIAKTLSEQELGVPVTERLLKLLEMVSACKEGRNQICGNEICIQAIVKKLLKVSNSATEHAVTILWSLCYLFTDKTAQDSVNKNNGMAKILLLMQSNCSHPVRQMCSDLLKVFRYNSKFSCLSCYETKTTHIMPF